MGLEQSTFIDPIANSRKKKHIPHQDSLSSGNISPLSGELPYYNYFAGKSIGTEAKYIAANKIDPPLPSSKSLNFSQMRSTKNLCNLQSNSLPEGITVVSQGKAKTVETDPFIQKLNKIPLPSPILKSGLQDVKNKSNKCSQIVDEVSCRLDHISESIKAHLKGLSETLIERQNEEVTPKITSLEESLNQMTRTLCEKSARLDSLLDAFTDSDFEAITSPPVLNKLQIDAVRLKQFCDELENKLAQREA